MKKDCFAYRAKPNGRSVCNVLMELFCKDGECGFYKSYPEYLAGLEKYPMSNDTIRHNEHLERQRRYKERKKSKRYAEQAHKIP